MQRTAWRATINEGYKDEYIRRHDEIWPEMVDILKKSGISNYTIFCTGNELFGYFESDKDAEYTKQVQAQSDVVAKWNAYNKDIMVMHKDPITGEKLKLVEVFRLD